MRQGQLFHDKGLGNTTQQKQEVEMLFIWCSFDIIPNLLHGNWSRRRGEQETKMEGRGDI